MNRVVFRADGNSEIGLGHITRCIALTNILQKEYEILFAVHKPSSSIIDTFRVDNILFIELDTININEFSALIRHSDIVVMDGYQFNDNDRIAIKNSGCKLVCIDDLANQYYTTDVIINHGSALVEDYKVPSYTKLCLGISFLLLRQPFLKATQEERKINDVDSIFICFGGSDSNNYTKKVVEASILSNVAKTIHVVVGGAYIYYDALIEYLKSIRTNVIVHKDISADKIVEVMKQCQIAIAPSSGISYELCCVGIGFLTGMNIDNQKYIHEFLKKEQLADSVLNFQEASVEFIGQKLQSFSVSKINAQISIQKRLFKNSQKNILRLFEKLYIETCCKIRRANTEDVMLYYNWVNDSEVRTNSVNTEPVLLENHENWFNKRLISPEHFFFVLEMDSKPVGQCRFDVDNGKYIINYSLDSNYRGKGLGEIIVKMSVEQLCMDLKRNPNLYAIVKKGNIASSKAFVNNSFKQQPEIIINDTLYEVYTK